MIPGIKSDEWQVIRPKIPLLALIFSLMFPGLGHLYAGYKKRGIVLIFITIVTCIPPLLFAVSHQAKTNIYLLAPLPALVLSSAFIAVDAYRYAIEYNREKGFSQLLRLHWPLIVAIVILYFSTVMVVTDVATVYVTDKIAIPIMLGSHSMEPTMGKDEIYLLDKLVYRKNNPQQGDIVIFRLPAKPGQDFIKRIIGLPEETLEIKDGKVYINEQLSSIPGANNIVYFNKGPLGAAGVKVKIPAGAYFVLGDNSAHSIDSRYWGFVERKDIRGQVLPVYYPFNKMGAWLKRHVDKFWTVLENTRL